MLHRQHHPSGNKQMKTMMGYFFNLPNKYVHVWVCVGVWVCVCGCGCVWVCECVCVGVWVYRRELGG